MDSACVHSRSSSDAMVLVSNCSMAATIWLVEGTSARRAVCSSIRVSIWANRASSAISFAFSRASKSAIVFFRSSRAAGSPAVLGRRIATATPAPARKMASRGICLRILDMTVSLIIWKSSAMQLDRKVTPVLGTYRNCGVIGLLSSLLGKILHQSFRSLLIEWRRRIRVFRQDLRCPSVVDGMRPVWTGGPDE